jgi:2-polyprenyl-6-methoxyphenol hydroxylase-like FAD-dependent oxidoreductase
MKIAIIGAGVGGLTAGLLLKRKGIGVKIFEQASGFKTVGAGIILAHNAMQVYKACGLYESISSVGQTVDSLDITNKDLNPHSILNTKEFDERYLVKNVAIHRAELHRILLDAFQGHSQICLNKELLSIERGPSCKLHFSDGSSEDFDGIIAADGINSVVRQTLYPKIRLRNTNQRCFRGIVNTTLPADLKNHLSEAWGGGDRFGFVQISDHQVYWYALHNIDQKYKGSDIHEIFNDYHPIIPELIQKTEDGQIFETEIRDLKPLAKWVDGNVCLLGDAAHATTPNLGQGACQAIEDAYVLSSCIESLPIAEAFSKYEKIRQDKAKMVVDLSWKFGKISQIQNPLAAAIRDKLIALIPASINKRNFHKIYALSDVV